MVMDGRLLRLDVTSEAMTPRFGAISKIKKQKYFPEYQIFILLLLLLKYYIHYKYNNIFINNIKKFLKNLSSRLLN